MNRWNLCDSCKKYDRCKMAKPGRTFEVCWDHSPITRADLVAMKEMTEELRKIGVNMLHERNDAVRGWNNCVAGFQELQSALIAANLIAVEGKVVVDAKELERLRAAAAWAEDHCLRPCQQEGGAS